MLSLHLWRSLKSGGCCESSHLPREIPTCSHIFPTPARAVGHPRALLRDVDSQVEMLGAEGTPPGFCCSPTGCCWTVPGCEWVELDPALGVPSRPSTYCRCLFSYLVLVGCSRLGSALISARLPLLALLCSSFRAVKFSGCQDFRSLSEKEEPFY